MVFLLTVSTAKMAEQIVMPFSVWILEEQGTMYYYTKRGTFGAYTKTCPDLPAADILNLMCLMVAAMWPLATTLL